LPYGWVLAVTRCGEHPDRLLTGVVVPDNDRNTSHNALVDRRTRSNGQGSSNATLDHMPARLVLERIPVPSLAIARNGRILFANEAFAEMVGHSTEALHSMEFGQLFALVATDESPVSVVRKYANQLVELMHADGSLVRARMSKSALMRDDDPLVLATFHDLTEQLWNQGR
jgi:PAS domain S-box-containing protein